MDNVSTGATLQPFRDIALPGYWGPQYSVFAPDGSYAVIFSPEPMVEVFGVASITLHTVAVALALLLLIIAGVLAYIRVRRYEHPGVPICNRCAYPLPEDMEDLPERCSECGAELREKRAVRLGRTRFRRAKAALIVTALSITLSLCGVFSSRIVGVFVHPETGSRSLYDTGVSLGLITPNAVSRQRFVIPYGLVARRLDVQTGSLTVLIESSRWAMRSTPVFSNDASLFAVPTESRVLVYDGATGAIESVLKPGAIQGAPADAVFSSMGGFSDDGSSLYGVWSPEMRFAPGDAGLFVSDTDTGATRTLATTSMLPVSNGAVFAADAFYPVPNSDNDLFIQYPSRARASEENLTIGDSWARLYRHSTRRFFDRHSVSLDSNASPLFAEGEGVFVVAAHLSGYTVVRIGGDDSLTITKAGTNPQDPFRPVRSLGSTGDLGMLAAQSWHTGAQAAQVSLYFPGEDEAPTELVPIPNALSINGVHLSSDGRFMAVEAAFPPASGVRARLLVYDISTHPRVAAYLEQRARGE